MHLFSGSSFVFESASELGGCVRIGDFTPFVDSLSALLALKSEAGVP